MQRPGQETGKGCESRERGLGGEGRNKSTDAVNMKAEFWGGRGLAGMGVGAWGQWGSG